jgi:hypothetical protein
LKLRLNKELTSENATKIKLKSSLLNNRLQQFDKAFDWKAITYLIPFKITN